MGYSAEDDMVRVDFFKPSGKWYVTEQVKWTGGYSDILIYRAFQLSLENAKLGYAGMTAVCLEPYHENAFPLMITNWGGL